QFLAGNPPPCLKPHLSPFTKPSLTLGPAARQCVPSSPCRVLRHSQPPLDLMRELEQRQQDLSRLAASAQARASLSAARRAEVAEPLGCAQLNGLSDVGVVGAGITKLVLRAVLSPGGEEIALKSVHWTGSDVSRCVQRYSHAEGCFQLAAYKLLKETILLQTLDHEGIIKLHGQCYNNSLYPEMKVVSMLELGTPLEMIQLLQIPWEERFKICLDLVELLYYLANSPLGSIALLDFQPRQFVMVNGLLKVTDLDDVSTEELSCKRDQDCILKFPTKTFFLKCASRRNCKGINEKRNLFNAYRYFFTYLLPHTAPIALQPILKDILNATGDLRYGANETLRAFQKVLHLYKSGLYLQKSADTNESYQPVDTEDYKCWPSYSPLRCMLSVHNVEEAASICNYHPQCQHFIITSQRTWTGGIELADDPHFVKDLGVFISDNLCSKVHCNSC
uniref:Protein kinase domain-containing protein n=1 Tax=Naja naja TaxID=35670 RepID=A0A8C6VM80_NAJNA